MARPTGGQGSRRAARPGVDRHPAGQGPVRARSPGDSQRPEGASRAASSSTGQRLGSRASCWRPDRSDPNRIAAYLGLEQKSAVVLRKILVERDGEPTEISATWVPAGVAEGTALAESADLRQGIRRYVESAAGVSLDHIIEHITARNPTAEERKLLGVKTRPHCWPCMRVACDATGKPWVVVESVLPGDLHELEDAYPIGNPTFPTKPAWCT